MTGVASCWFIEEGSRELQVARLKLAGKAIILKAIDQAKGSYTEAAKLLRVHPNYLHRLIRNLNLKNQLKI